MVAEGTQAPDFELTDDAGNTVRLSDFRGQPVVLYFYPKDDTPGCTKEACDLRDSYAEFQQRGAVILGISPDDEASHAQFRQKHKLPFMLLADPGRNAIDAYGVWGELKIEGKSIPAVVRSTFVIDADGTVARAMYGVSPEGHADAVLAALP
jgi:peroxiredoxin Q/BCP